MYVQLSINQCFSRLPAVQETWVPPLGWGDPLEKEMATHSSILAWRIPWTEEPGRLQSTGSQRVGHDWATSLYPPTACQVSLYMLLNAHTSLSHRSSKFLILQINRMRPNSRSKICQRLSSKHQILALSH